MNRRRLGRFWLNRTAIDDNFGSLAYKDLIPLDVRHDFATDRFDVTAMGDDFDEVERGQEIPRYLIEFTDRDSAGVRVGWYRCFSRMSGH